MRACATNEANMSLLIGKESFGWFDDSGPASDISGGSDSWNTFYLGILIGIGGGAVTCLSPWLGGALFAVGYGMTACSLRGSASRVSNALLFGFKWAAIAGALLFAGVFLFPESTGAFVEAVGRRHAIFLGVATLPWMIAIVKYASYYAQPATPQVSKQHFKISPKIKALKARYATRRD